MMNIEIRGFQSIEHVALKVEGFTALVGRSGIGKTAIVRAVKAALTNALGTSYVRHGAACLRRTKGTKTCKCEVMVHLRAPGFDLKWRKGDAVNEYVFNGETKTVPGRGFPEFLSPAFAPIQLGDSQKILQISDQFFPLFLLDQSGSTVANILSDVARLDAVNVAMKHVEKDRREASSLRKVREKDVEGLVKSQKTYVGLDDVLVHAGAVGEEYERLCSVERAATVVAGLHVRLQGLAVEIRAIQGVEGVHPPDPGDVRRQAATCLHMAALSERLVDTVAAYRAIEGSANIVPPDVTHVRETSLSLSRLRGFAQSHHDSTAFIRALDDVSDLVVPDPSDLAGLARRVSVFSDLHAQHMRVTIAVASLDGVETIDPPNMSSLTPKGQDLVRVGEWATRLQSFRTWFDACRGLEEIVVSDPSSLSTTRRAVSRTEDLARRHTTLRQTIEALEAQYATVSVEHAEAEAALTSFLDTARANGWVCGECGQTLKGNHAHNGVAA